MSHPKLKRMFLIFPPSTSLASWEPMVTMPMGIAYLAASARQAGYEVGCLDCVVEAPYQETPVDDQISRYGLTYEQIMHRIRAFKPDAVGLSCIFSNQWPAVRELAGRIKAEMPEIPILCGGAHPTFLSELCMKDAPLDYILRGESEETLVDLLDRLRDGRPVTEVDGLVWREDGAVRKNEKTAYIHDLDRLPFPAHDLLDPERYFKLALPMAYDFISPRNIPIVTSRGCPCSCTFCSSTQLWGKRYRVRSAENVLKEMDWLVETFGIKELKFQDDNLTVNRDRARQIFQGMIDRPWHLHWNTPNGIAIWTLDEEMLGLMKKSGCFGITLAIESGSQEVLTKLIKKPLKLDKVREVNRIAREKGISRAAYFIVGFPGETREQIQQTVKFSRELKLGGWALFIYNPLPGSELYLESIRRGYITEENFFQTGNQYFSTNISSEEWTGEELEALIRREYAFSYFIAMLYNPWVMTRRYLLFLRYRPSFLKYFIVRTWRTLLLQLRQKRSAAKAQPAG